MNLTAGILIIGSLYWDIDPERMPHRLNWYKRLNKAGELAVTVPIRYGRRSQSRNNTFTMVFSPQCELGVAKILPCANAVTSFDSIVAEARELWAAEQSNVYAATSAKGVSASWGRVGLLCNPNMPPDTYKSLTEAWAICIRQMGYSAGKPAPDGPVVDSRGMLQIPWPRLAGTDELASLDLLFATATSPTVDPATGAYFPAETIADVWNADQENRVEYFVRNREAGIRTFQDDEIACRLITLRATRS